MRKTIEDQSGPERKTGRIEALSDGIIAIAVTLLVLDLRVPEIPAGTTVSSSALAHALLSNWPGYAALVTSFFCIFVMWTHHHAVFKLLHQVDSKLTFANGFLLLIITFVPFPTAVVARYFLTPAATAAALFYAGTFVMIAVAFSIWLNAALREPNLRPDASPEMVKRLRASYRGGPLIYLAAMAAAFISPTLTMLICTGSWILWTVVTLDTKER